MPELRPIQGSYIKAVCANCGVLELSPPLGLTGPELERLDAVIVQRVKVKKEGALYRTGDPLRSLYVVRTGSFKTSMVSADGREQVTGFQISGEMLGLDAISTNQHACNAFALEDCEVFPIHFAQLEKLGCDLPALQHNLNMLMSREIVHDLSMLMLMGNMTSYERLAAFLLNLSQRLNVRGHSSREFVLKMRREDIGSFLGLRLETICRGIGHLESQELLELSGRNVKILNIEGLKNFVTGCHWGS